MSSTPLPGVRPPRRFRWRGLLGLMAPPRGPLARWGLAARSLLQGALQVAPPVESLLGRSADALERRGGDAPLVDELRGAELRLAQAELARRRLLDRVPRDFLFALGATVALVAVAAW